MATTFPTIRCGICGYFFQMNSADEFLCPKCRPSNTADERYARAFERERTAFHEAKARSWASICPPLYRESDPARLPAAAVQAITNYTFGPASLGFIGPARIGKTRTMFQLVARLIREEHRLDGRYIYGPEFSSEVSARGAEFPAYLKDFLTCSFLFFDDVGAGRLTPAVEANFLLLLETRAKNERPTFWTSNVGPKGLAAMMSAENGPRIIGRLLDFSTPVDL